jgi:Mrp family chromosome partitioning ATPase
VTSALDASFTGIRTTLQSALALPCAVTISSTLRRDGKTAVAVGVARNFAQAGFTTLVVDANADAPAVGRALELAELPVAASLDPAIVAAATVRAETRVSAVSIAAYRLIDGASAEEIATLVGALRARYDVTIVDGGEVFSGPFIPRCAAACDGVVLAVRYARFPDPEDARVVATLQQAGATIVGSVPTSLTGELLL